MFSLDHEPGQGKTHRADATSEGVEITLDLWEVLITRLRGQAKTYRQIMLATNPSHPQHWIKQRADDGG